MKRKLLIAMILSYTMLVGMILAIGLYIQQTEQPSTVETEATISKSDENVIEISQTTIVNTRTQTEIPTPSPVTETLVSPSLEPSISEEPTQAEETATPSAPTSTSPAYPINGEGTTTTTATPQSYPVDNSTTSTKTSTSIPISQTGWGGEWTVYTEQPDGSYLSGLMNVSIDGSDLSATVSLGTEQYIFEGILNESQIIAVGSWSGSLGSGNFYWRTLTLDQFVGNMDSQFGFCGSRAENNLPDPCFKTPSEK